ncbi:MAG TPA: hypothetical protein VHT05_06065 [Candidatus Elarobacter sp.]|jgi:hypothetical protein|nr:hypothetical protein [Candidatus Elarobacter sp.]
MRKTLILATVLALAGCGGGGGGSTSPQPPAPSTPSPQGPFVTPQFTIVIPSGKSGSSASKSTKSTAKRPSYVSSATLSVQITLTADSNGVTPNTISGNPATTTIPSGSCNSGCTVNGPPSPPGTDSFLIVTYDNNVPASGHALNAGKVSNVTITAGQNNPESVTLGAIPSTLTVNNIPTGAGAFVAGTTGQATTVSVAAADAAGVTIPTGNSPNVIYVDATGTAINVTLSDPDTNAHGSCVIDTGTSSCTSGATSVTFSGPDITKVFAYDGLAENPVTLTASASPATNGTASFQPKLNAPVFVSSQATPAPAVAQSGSAETDLFATSGIGSTGSESFTESGWTNSPYNQALTHAETGACVSGAGLATAMSQIATISVGTNSTSTGTPITATAVGSPTPGSCPSTISDGLSLNLTDGSATLTVTYTTSSISASSLHRKTH